MSKVLVTGAAGYIGSVLCGRLLDAGHEVVALDNMHYGQTPLFHYIGRPGFTFIRGDVRDRRSWNDVIKTCDVLIPLAAMVGASVCKRDKKLATEVNTKAVAEMVCESYHNPIVVYTNTNSAYGSVKGVCTEETPMKPLSHYAETKCDAESIVLRQKRGISLRLATVFGASPRPRLDLLVNDFAHRAWKDGAIHVFQGYARRNYIHIHDVCDAILFAMEDNKAMAGRAWNVGNDDLNMTKRDLARSVAEHFPRTEVLESTNGFDPDKRDYEVSSAAIGALGFKATRSLEQGLDELYQLFNMLPFSRWGNA